MFGLTKWEKFRKHVLKSQLPPSPKQLSIVLDNINFYKITNKESLVKELREPIGKQIYYYEEAHPIYDKLIWDLYQYLVDAVEERLPEFK